MIKIHILILFQYNHAIELDENSEETMRSVCGFKPSSHLELTNLCPCMAIYQSHAEQARVQMAQALKDTGTVEQEILQLVLDGLGISRLASLDQLFSTLEQIIQSTRTLSNCLLKPL